MTFAFRGATHLMTPEDGGVYLALRAASRQWELKSWREYYGLAPSDWPSLDETVRDALAAGPLTLTELVAAIATRPKFAHLGPILAGNPWSVMKALAWRGVLCKATRVGAGSAGPLGSVGMSWQTRSGRRYFYLARWHGGRVVATGIAREGSRKGTGA